MVNHFWFILSWGSSKISTPLASGVPIRSKVSLIFSGTSSQSRAGLIWCLLEISQVIKAIPERSGPHSCIAILLKVSNDFMEFKHPLRFPFQQTWHGPRLHWDSFSCWKTGVTSSWNHIYRFSQINGFWFYFSFVSVIVFSLLKLGLIHFLLLGQETNLPWLPSARFLYGFCYIPRECCTFDTL